MINIEKLPKDITNLETNQESILYKDRKYLFEHKPDDFMKSEMWKLSLQSLISHFENGITNQQNVDIFYNELCNHLFKEMDLHLNFKTIGSKRERKKLKLHKPFWNSDLSNLWKSMREKENIFTKFKGHRHVKNRLYTEYKESQLYFDKKLRFYERSYNREKIEEFDDIVRNPKQFWNKLKNLGPRNESSIPIAVRLPDNTFDTNINSVLERWKHDFSQLYKFDIQNIQDSFYQNIKSEKGIFEENMRESSYVENDFINRDISYDEIENLVLKLKNKKASGIDCIQNEILKEKDVILILWHLFRNCFNYSVVPSVWLKGIISPIPKGNKDPYVPLNYRGISLLSCVSKLYSAFLNKRIVEYCNILELFPDEQNGFRKDRNCEDHIFTFTSLIQNRLVNKTDTFAAFIDLEKAFDCVDRELLLYRLLLYNIDGKIYRAVKNLYSNTTSCIRLNNLYTPFFEIDSGVRQGDTLSPTLFSLYLNDLVKEINNLNLGIKVDNNTMVSILLFADDMVLMANNECDLQNMLDCLQNWCLKWRLRVNLDKTKVIHFRNNRKLVTNHVFKFSESTIEIVSCYKYLGILIDEHLTFEKCAKLLSESGGRALGSIISKFKILKNCGFKTFEKLYSTGMCPILDYSACVWGYGKFHDIDNIQNKAIRYFLGVHKFAPLAGIEGEMGWTNCRQRRHECILKFWNRLIKMENSRLTKRVFLHDFSLKHNNWSNNVCSILSDLDMQASFENMTVVDINLVREKLRNLAHVNWQLNVENKPKLRTYKMFKTNFETSSYLYMNISKHERSLLAQFRLGILPLHIETGRFRNKLDSSTGKYRRLEINERTCNLCNNEEIENEMHFLLHCTSYENERRELFDKARNKNEKFMTLTENEKFIYLLSTVIRPTVKFLDKAWNIRKELLYNNIN